MTITAIVITLYGLFVLLGGIAGYITTGSQPSLRAGIASGVALFICVALLIFHQATGWILAMLVMAALLALFGMRYVKTRKMMPGGMNAIVSSVALLATLLLGLRHL